MLEAFDKATARTVDFDSAFNAFILLNQVPRDFRAVIEHMVLSGETDMTNLAENYKALTVDEDEYSRLWKQFKPIDQALLTWLALDRGGPYQEDAREFIANWIGVDKVAQYTIQNALNRLRGNYLAPVEQGVWAFEDLNFKQWVMQAFDGI